MKTSAKIFHHAIVLAIPMAIVAYLFLACKTWTDRLELLAISVGWVIYLRIAERSAKKLVLAKPNGTAPRLDETVQDDERSMTLPLRTIRALNRVAREAHYVLHVLENYDVANLSHRVDLADGQNRLRSAINVLEVDDHRPR